MFVPAKIALYKCIITGSPFAIDSTIGEAKTKINLKKSKNVKKINPFYEL